MSSEDDDYVFGMPLSFVTGTIFHGSINIYGWKKIKIEINYSNVYNDVLKYNFCTCVHNYDEIKCNCINVVATMLIRREVHKVIAYFKEDSMFANPTSVEVQSGGWKTSFDVSVFRHDQSNYCLCDNFSEFIQVNWDQLVGEDGSASSDCYDETLKDLFHSSGTACDIPPLVVPPKEEEDPTRNYMFFPLDKPFINGNKYGMYKAH